MDANPLYTLIFWIMTSVVVVYSLPLVKNVGSHLSNAKTIINDFRSGKYYKPWNSKKLIIVSTKKEIQELSEASALSQRAVYADIFGFKHTLNNLDHHEITTQKSRLLGRLIQVNGVRDLPKIFPYLEKAVQQSTDEMLRLGKPTSKGISLPIAKTVRTIVSRAMCVIFFGEKLSHDPSFANALLDYPRELVNCMAAFQIAPSFLSSIVHNILTDGGKTQRFLLQQIADIVGPGRDDWREDADMKELTFAWHVVELAKGNAYWQGPEHLAQTMLGVWFAAAHQPWMSLDFIMLQLSLRRDIQQGLRDEIGDASTLDYTRLSNLPLLDSFIKEVARLHPLDTVGVRRKALKDYTFADQGVYCPSGSTVCAAAYDRMHDSNVYPNPEAFQPRRFIDIDSPACGAKFTDVSEKYLTWGFGSLACPGRFHASIVIKLVITHLVMQYDISLENEMERRLWSWETFNMPYESTRFILEERPCRSRFAAPDDLGRVGLVEGRK